MLRNNLIYKLQLLKHKQYKLQLQLQLHIQINMKLIKVHYMLKFQVNMRHMIRLKVHKKLSMLEQQ